LGLFVRDNAWLVAVCCFDTLQETLGIIAGNGVYPLILAKNARIAGVKRIVVAAFVNETKSDLGDLCDEIEWMRVGQLGKMIKFFQRCQVKSAIMAGQIDPKNLFDLRPDVRTLVMLARLEQRNAESIFGAIADELTKAGVTLLPATTYMEDHLAPEGHVCGPALSRKELSDLDFGFEIAKQVSRMDIGQTVVVKGGTVLAVEAFEGTNAAILRGGELGRKDAVMVKVSKPGQDFRFDVPVVGPQTLQTAAAVKIRVIGVEAGRTLLLERDVISSTATSAKISIFGYKL
jgi:DUF1009 family protein